MFVPPQLPNLNAAREPLPEDWDSLGPDDRNTKPTEVPTEQLPENNGFTPPDVTGDLPEGVYRRGPLTGPRRQRPNRSAPDPASQSRVDRSAPITGTPREAGRMEISHDGFRSEDDPAFAGVNARLSAMLKGGESEEAITSYLSSIGINPASINLADAFAFRRSPHYQVWRRERPNDAWPINVDDRLIPVSGVRQFFGRAGDSAGGAFVMGAADTLTFGHLDEASAAIASATADNDQSFSENYDRNVEDMRIVRDQVASNNPNSYFVGQLAGSLVPWNRFGLAGNTARSGAAMGGINGFLYGWGSGDGDAGQRFRNATVQGGIGTVIGGGIGRASNRAEQSYIAGQDGQEVLDAASRLNTGHNLADQIRPLPAHVGGPVTRRLVGGSEAMLFGGRALDEAGEAFTRQMQGGVAAVTGTVNPAREVLGEAATAIRNTANPNGFANLPQRALERSSQLYDDAHRLAGGSRFQTPDAVSILDDTIARLRAQPGVESPQLPGLVQLRQDLVDGGISIQALRDLRTRMGTMIDNNDGIQRGLGKRMWGALSEDIERGLRNSGRGEAAGAFRRADTAYRNALGHQERVEALLAGSHEDVTARLVNMSRTDSRGLRQALQSMAPEEAEQVRAGIVQMLGRATSGAQDEAGRVFSLQSFLTNFDRISPEARQSLFPGQLRQDLLDLATLARGARAGGAFRNNSRSGNAINIATIIGGISRMGAKSGGAYLVGGLPAAAASGLISLSLGRLLASPGFARVLVLAERTGQTRAAFLRRLGGFANRNPHLQNDVQVFTDYVTSDDATQQPENRPISTWEDTAPAPEYYEAQNAIANTPQPVAIETPQGTMYIPREVFGNDNSSQEAPQPVSDGEPELDQNGDDWSQLGPPQ